MRNSIQTLPDNAVINFNVKIIAPKRNLFKALDERYNKKSSKCKCIECDKNFTFEYFKSISWVFCSENCREKFYSNYK